ncbi:MAG: FxsA family protein, partial [Verrucomicrobiota bacterium]
LLELVLLLQVGTRIGIVTTIGIIFFTGVLGAWLSKTQGVSVLLRARQAMESGRMPQEEVLEGLMILIAAAVLLTPGFLTDALGFFLLVPLSRAWLRPHVSRYLQRRIKVMGAGGGGFSSGMPGHASAEPDRPRTSASGETIIDAEIVEPDQKD